MQHIIPVQQKNPNVKFGYLFAIAATVIWAGNFIFAKGLAEIIPPLQFAFWRWVVALFAIFPFAIRPLRSDWKIIKAHLPYVSLCSMLGVSLFSALVYIASHSTSAINLSLIAITFPIFILLISRVFFQEYINGWKGAGIVLVFTGVLLLITKGELSKLLNISFAIGDIWMLIAAIAFAIYSILLRHKPKELSVWSFQFITYGIGILFLLPFVIWESITRQQFEINATVIYAFLYGGIFTSFVGFVLWNKAVILVGPVKAGFIYYTLPIFSGILAYIFLDEIITSVHFYSVLLIVSGILTANHKTPPPIKEMRDPHPLDSKYSSYHRGDAFTSS